MPFPAKAGMKCAGYADDGCLLGVLLAACSFADDNLFGIVNMPGKLFKRPSPERNKMVVLSDAAIWRIPVNSKVRGVDVSFGQFLFDKLPDDDSQWVFVRVHVDSVAMVTVVTRLKL